MARWAYIIAVFGALAAWAGAQGPHPALGPADQLRLLKANGTLIDHLVDHGIELSRADTVDKRAEQCRRAAKALSTAVQDAAGKQEAERVAELTGLFRNVVDNALLPVLEDGRQTVTPGSPGEQQLRKTRAELAKDVAELRAAIPKTGKVAENARVKSEMSELDKLSRANRLD